MSSSYNFVLDGSENGGGYDNSQNYSLSGLTNNPPNTKGMNNSQAQCNHSELLSLMHQMLMKIDRQGAELISLRNEISVIKGRVCGEAHKAKLTLPSAPKATIGDFEAFEECLKEEKSLKNLSLN
ncbi:uncharacterized protein LOC135441237 isoform X2 [Drosophila montana]|uniref:uncharacterized protein LOC135441237 isoform X2 n=1 Tax=Drosophila montana TaxID=40370 RepID=UPI00313E384F